MDEFGSDKFKRGKNKVRLPQLSALLLLLAGIASAQLSTPIQPATCVKITNCVLYDTTGNMVWSDINWNSTTGAYQGFLEYGISPNQQEFTNLVQYPVANPVDPQPNDTNHILFSVQFKSPDGTLYTETLKGFSYYSRGSGGRGGGGAGYRYSVTSGTITVQEVIQ